MSWEETWSLEATCPCGKGLITQKQYENDWNMSEVGPVIIECEDCLKKYEVEALREYELKSNSFFTEYFLIPKGYPHYNGPSEYKIYGSRSYPDHFTAWLIENFTEQELNEVMGQLNSVKASSQLVGNGANIRKEHKRYCHTVKVSNIKSSIEKAIKAYPGYIGNKMQRHELAAKERAARRIYEEEKDKYRIRIDLHPKWRNVKLQ